MKFGKHIQVHQVPGWSSYYLDYKFLKKIISSLAANRPASEAAALALGVRPPDVLNQPATLSSDHQLDTRGPQIFLEDDRSGQPPLFSAHGQDEDRGADFQAHKAAFFFKIERELEKINAFYLQREAGLKLRLETLLSKRRAAAMRGLPDVLDDSTQNHVEWSAVEEGFRVLDRDLGKLQQFIEINATGFRKILKKWDKRSKSSTKELYLARQVDMQPVFNRQLISELCDTVTTCRLDLTDLSSGLKFEGRAAHDILTQQIMSERTVHMGPFHDLENNLRKAVASADETAVTSVVNYSDVLAQQNGGKTNVTRILWRVIIEAPPELADLILSKLASPLDFHFIDDINGRTCLHEAAIAGTLRLVNICLEKGVQTDKVDVYGRSALHYASINGHADVCRRLLEAKLPPNILDMDNYSPLVYATLRGSVDCVRVLLEDTVFNQLIAPVGDLIPLSLASQSGHVEVVLLLLHHGAKSLPNSNGEYPIHLAAKQGHADVCRHLLRHEGWDTPDKYHEWTPVFHAARHGHESCIEVFLQARCRVDAIDELGNTAVHYAAWYSHHSCVKRLLEAAADFPATDIVEPSPLSDIKQSVESEIDLIPSLSLPPPIMPHHVYGHNYLDKSYLVQVSIGQCSSRVGESGVRLHPRLINPAYQDVYDLASTPLKLVMTTSPDVNSAPYSILLPQRDKVDVFTFQIPSPNSLSLEFSIYPNFGTKTIGRAIALPSLFTDIENKGPFILPILDNRLHVVGEVSFEVNIVTPFEGVTLEVGGDVETYWKSTAVPPYSLASRTASSRWQQSSGSVRSTHTSPSTHSVAGSVGRAMTVSSLRGNYVYVVVQVTRDFHPVIFADWRLPETGFDLGVSDVTLAQFEALARRVGRNLDLTSLPTATDLHALMSHSMLSLAQLMKVLPVSFGLSLELAFPSRKIRERYALRHKPNLNQFVASVLRTIYYTSASLEGLFARRRIVFISFCPDVCVCLNWKQPNYPVFFASQCGKKCDYLPSPTALTIEDESDGRLHSLSGAVEFAKRNNLLGLFLEADLLVQVPSLIQGLRNAELLIGIYGSPCKMTVASSSSVDAFLMDGVVVYTDHPNRD